MKFQKVYSIKKGEWTRWSDTIADAIKDFCSVYTFYPNILEANDHTFSQFDFLANINPDDRRRVTREEDIIGLKFKVFPDETENINLSVFNFGNETGLDFAIDNHLPNKEFRLVYDDDPEWDEPEVPENCPVNELELCLC